MKRLISSFLLALSALAIVAAPVALATDGEAPQINFRVSPVGERIRLDAGEQIEKVLNITNQSDVDSRIRLYAAPYTVEGQNYDSNFSTETPRTQIHRWIEFDQTDVTVVEEEGQPTKYEYPVAAQKTFTANYTITVPEDVADGGQYAIIFVESVSDAESSSDTTSIKTNYRIGVPILANIGGATRDGAEIIDLKLPVFFIGSNNRLITGSTVVRNTGNTDFPMVQTLEVKTIFGREVYKDSRSADVFPDTERAEKLAWEETPFIGIFWATYTVNALEQTSTSSHIVIVLPIFIVILIILLLTISIIWLILILGKRRERAKKVKMS